MSCASCLLQGREQIQGKRGTESREPSLWGSGNLPSLLGSREGFPGEGAESSRCWDQRRVHAQKWGQFPFLVPWILSGGSGRQRGWLEWGALVSRAPLPLGWHHPCLPCWGLGWGTASAEGCTLSLGEHSRQKTCQANGKILLIWAPLLVKNISMKSGNFCSFGFCWSQTFPGKMGNFCSFRLLCWSWPRENQWLEPGRTLSDPTLPQSLLLCMSFHPLLL